MKQLFNFLCLAMLSIGCVSKKENRTTIGPLSDIKEYHVVSVFPFRGSSSSEILLTQLIEDLQKIGIVDISDDCFSNTSSSSAQFIISLNELEEIPSGSIRILAEGEVLINRYKASCDVWSTIYRDPRTPTPVLTENGIDFQRDSTVVSPDRNTVISQMIGQFAERYRQDNPKDKPVFHLSKMF